MAEIDISKLSASVSSITPATADAKVRLEATESGPEFVFSFKLPAGQDGKDGTNVIGTVLTDENVWVPCLDDGTPDPDLGDIHASTQILLKDGDSIITKGVSYTIVSPDTPGEFTVDRYGDVSVKLTKDSAEVIEITCNAVYNKTEHSRTFYVRKAIGTPVYKVVPDVSAIKQDNAIKIPSVLRVDVLKWNGKSWGITSELPVMYNYKLVDGDKVEGLFANEYWIDNDTVEYSIDVANFNALESLEVYIEKDGVKLDYQSVSIVKDGIGVISAYAYTTISSDMDISNCTVKGGSYWTINDPDTYRTFETFYGEDKVDITWTPTNSNQRNDAQRTWMITQVFSSTDDASEEQVWSSPIILQDSDYFQVEYCSNDVETPPTPVSFTSIIAKLVNAGEDRSTLTSERLEEEWRNTEAQTNDENGNPWIWSDTATNPKWMATCRLQNGEWSKWTVTKCRGEIGYNAQQIELSNESEYVPCVNVVDPNDSNKTIWIPDEDLYKGEDGETLPIASTEVVLMDGHSNITNTCKIKIECSDSKITSWTGDNEFGSHEVKVDNKLIWEFKNEGTKGILNVYNINDDITHFTITLTYENPRHERSVEYVGTFKIVKVKNATTYKISSNVNAIKVDSKGNACTDNLEISLLKWNGQRWESVALSQENTFSLTWDCSGVSNVNQTKEVTKNDLKNSDGISPDSYSEGKLVINISDESYYPNGYPGQFIFTIPIKKEDGTEIGVETESIPVMSDGINISNVYEYYAISNTNSVPDIPNDFPTVNDWNGDLNKDYGSWKVNKIPELTVHNPYLWNIEVVTNSWGDVVDVTEAALLGTYGADGMTPYAVLEFYDIDKNPPEEAQDPKTEYVCIKDVDGSTLGNNPIPTSENPYLYGFEKVLYGKEGYNFAHPEVFYSSDHKWVENPAYDTSKDTSRNDGYSDKELVDKGLIKAIDTPVSLISKIGAGSFTEQVYKYVAKGNSTKSWEELAELDVLKVPGDIGSYANPSPDGYTSEEQTALDKWNNWTDGIPSKVYDWDNNELTDYDNKVDTYGGKVLYMSLRTFTTDGKSPQDLSWKPATIASDVEGKVDFEWSNVENPGDPTNNPNNWTNQEGRDSIWMAVRHMSTGGAWEKWTVSKIKGEKGDGSLHLELSNDFTMVPTDSDGNVIDSNWDEEGDEEGDEGQDLAYSEAKLFSGLSDITDFATFQWEVKTGTGNLEDANTANCSLLTMTTDAVMIRCTATYNGTSISKDFNVVKSKGQPVYKLVPSAHLFTYGTNGSNNASPTEITFKVNKWTGYEYKEVTNPSTEGLTITNSSGDSIVRLSASKSDQIVYLKSGTVVLDQETIGYVEGGSDGADGADGDPGRGISSISVRYASANQGTSSDDLTWQDKLPDVQPGFYIWTKTEYTYTDGSTSDPIYTSVRSGADLTVSEETVTYVASSSGTTIPTSGWSEDIPSVSEGNYLWTRTTTTYSSGKTNTRYTVTKQGKTGNAGTSVTIKSASTEYSSSSAGTTPPESGWQTAIPSVDYGNYLWTRVIVEYSDGNETTSYSSAYQGKDGSQGDSGPAMVYRGKYESEIVYYGNSTRTDCVLYNDKYYIAKSTANTSPFINQIPGDNTDYWMSFGDNFSSIATGTLLAENANVGNMIFTGGKFTDSNGGDKFYIDGTNGTAMFASNAVVFEKDKATFSNACTFEGTLNGAIGSFSGTLSSTSAEFGKEQTVYLPALNSNGTYVPMTVDATGDITFRSFQNDSVNTSIKRIKNIIKIGSNGIQISSGTNGAPRLLNGTSYPLNTTNVSGVLSTSIDISSSVTLNSSWSASTLNSQKPFIVSHTITLGEFNVTGNGKISMQDGFFQTSDESLKNFEEDINIDFDKLKNIPKKYFTWKSDENKVLNIGTSAQKVQKLYPEVVTKNEDKLTVDYSKLSIIALAAIDKLYEELTEVKKKLDNLKPGMYGNNN